GGQPFDGLLIYSNMLYGTASGGGTAALGTIFRLNLDGSGFTNLYNFPAGGGIPHAGLIAISNVLYGTSSTGGSLIPNYGALFRMNPDASPVTNLTSFYPSTATNVAFAPVGGLISADGKFYGTCSGSAGKTSGTVFSIGIDGSGYTNLFVFQGVAGQNKAS